MKEQLRDDLLEYLGELKQMHQVEGDWIAKDKLADEINAANTLLGFQPTEKKTFHNLTDFKHETYPIQSDERVPSFFVDLSKGLQQ